MPERGVNAPPEFFAALCLFEAEPAGISDPVSIPWKWQKKKLRRQGLHEVRHVCPVCGIEFFGRRNRVYCCRKCRKKAWRLRRKKRLAEGPPSSFAKLPPAPKLSQNNLRCKCGGILWNRL